MPHIIPFSTMVWPDAAENKRWGNAADKAKDIACPVFGFYGGNDERVNATIPEAERLLKTAGTFRISRLMPAIVMASQKHSVVRASSCLHAFVVQAVASSLNTLANELKFSHGSGEGNRNVNTWGLFDRFRAIPDSG